MNVWHFEMVLTFSKCLYQESKPLPYIKNSGYEIDFVAGCFGQNELFFATHKNEP
jgi:hypothetical protein